ncbi:MAG TPA: EAL domain-containing protein [Gammaproteobacteria bacterium]|nr:EAL domain-containing protein [Gammaproteobacteria bacterium]
MKPESASAPLPQGLFRTLVEQTAGVVGQDYFRHLVRTLATSLDTEYAFVTARKPEDNGRLVLIAGWHVNHAAAGNGEFFIAGTPAARVLAEGQLWHEDGAANLYPQDRWLRKHGVRGYCAVAIPGLDGHPIGHMGVMSRHPFEVNDELFATLRLLASRCAAELRRRRLDEVQRLTGMKFATSFRAAPGIIAISELESGKFTDVNQAVERILGYSPAEIIGRTALELGVWEFLEERADILEELRVASRVSNREVHLLTRSGEKRRGLLSAEVVEIERRPCILSSVQDITDYRAALDALHQRDLSYQALFNIGTDIALVYRVDTDGRAAGPLLEVNDAACAVLGYSREEFLEMVPSALGDSENWRNAGRQLLKERAINFESQLRCKDGTALPVRVRGRLLVLDGRNTVLLVCRDLSSGSIPDGPIADVERKYRSIFENAVEGIYQSTPDGRIISGNPALARILGYDSPEAMIASGLNIASRAYVHPEQRAILLGYLEKDGFYADQEFQIFRRDDTPIWISDNARIVRDDKGNILYYEGFIQDITPRKLAEQALVQSEEKYRTLVDTNQDGVFMSQSGSLVYVNQTLAKLLGYDAADLIGKPILDLIAAESRAFAEELAADLPDENASDPKEVQLLHRDGETRVAVSVSIGRISWRGQPAITGTVRDVTEHKKAEQELVYSAYHDALTGLPNRSFFLERLTRAIERSGKRGSDRFAVLFLDLDRFKLINDSLGHTFGDRLLVAIAKRLRACLRPSDLIARHGGDEFTILVENIQGLDEATAVADRAHEELARAFTVDGHDVFSTASIGIVISAPHYRHPDEVLRDADTAMYRAKAAGKSGYVVFDDAMHERVKENLKLETELRHALQRGEFRVFYQPVMELASGKLKGFEALVRWDHPTRGLVAPADFLSVAEETGLIIPIGWWVMETACTQLNTWRKRFKHLTDDFSMSVNIANRQFAHWVLPQRVARVLDLTGVAPKNLCLEITETVFMDNPELAAETIDRLKSIGVSLQMDDFGTGYSSLSALRTFKLDTLKIDRSFVTGIERNRRERAIVRTITVLAADLGMDVVAEGIENARQLELLRALSCRKGQGYYFSKPFSASEAERYLLALEPPK